MFLLRYTYNFLNTKCHLGEIKSLSILRKYYRILAQRLTLSGSSIYKAEVFRELKYISGTLGTMGNSFCWHVVGESLLQVGIRKDPGTKQTLENAHPHQGG